MKTVITAIANPIINNELKKEKNIEVIGNDIQYKDGVIEILEKNIEVNYIILSDILIGEELLINLIRKINEKDTPVVFILWGNFAKSKKSLITNPKHLVIESSHPSPFSCNYGFFGSRPFSKANNFLKEHNIKEIDFTVK